MMMIQMFTTLAALVLFASNAALATPIRNMLGNIDIRENPLLRDVDALEIRENPLLRDVAAMGQTE